MLRFEIRQRIWGERNRDELWANAAAVFSVRAAGAGLAVAVNIVMARWLGLREFGVYSFAFGLLTWLAVAGRAGLDSGLHRVVARDMDVGNTRRARSAIWFALAFSGLLSTVLSMGVSLWMGPSRTAFAPYAGAVRVGSLLLPVLAGLAMARAALIAVRRPVVGEMLDGIARPGLVLAGALLCASILPSARAETGLTLQIVAHAAAGIAGYAIVQRSFSAAIGPKWNAGDAANLLRISLPMLVMGGFSIGLSEAVVLALGWIGTSEDVGLFSAAAKVAGPVTFGLHAVNSYLNPRIAVNFSDGRLDDLRRDLRDAATFLLVVSGALSLVTVVLGRQLLELFGLEFAGAYPAVVVLVLGQFASALCGASGSFMKMAGYQDQAMVIVGLACTVTAFLAVVLVPTFGIVGAATATSLGIGGSNLAMVVFIRKRHSLDTTVLQLLKPARGAG